MDIRQLRYFIQVLESGSFSKAAEQLHVAQPSLSQHVRHMEEDLGVKLLHRGPKGVIATEAGERLLLRARNIVAEFAELRDAVRGAASMPRGEVRFGMPGTVSEILAAPLIEAARRRYPEIRIRIAEAMSGYILDWLTRGDVELAIIYSAANPRGLAVHHVLSEEIALFASRLLGDGSAPRGGTVELAEAAALPLIIPGRQHGLRELIENAAASIGVAVEPSIEIDSYSQIKKLAQRGLGYGILPRMAVSRGAETDMFRIWAIEEPEITRKVYLAYSTEKHLSNASRAIGQLAWEILRELVRDGTWVATTSGESQKPSLYG
ncbi:MAG: LysR family transcriptional regulator [Neoaquamicrobium sediminum]|uniref:LysR family transcriptional regulator n=1 Tax=Neoaquamicrobium sediminum TaxID=1849104 RepID=UPI004037243D